MATTTTKIDKKIFTKTVLLYEEIFLFMYRFVNMYNRINRMSVEK